MYWLGKIQRKYMAVIMILMFFCLSILIIPVSAEKTVDCEKAFAKCSLDAAIVAVGNPALGSAYLAMHCIPGYIFCKKYLN